MLQVIESEDHVVAVQLSGTLTAEDIAQVAKEVDARLERHEKIGIFADLTGFHDLTAEAAAKDFSYSFSKIGQWRRFPREAVVTDKQWVRTLIKLIDPLLPIMEVRAFEPAQRDEALTWAGSY